MVNFKLFVIDSWDGNGEGGPDEWRVTADGTTLWFVTFSNIAERNQNYPSADASARTGASEIDTLGYAVDSVYFLKKTFTHSGNFLTLNFSNSVSSDEERFGLDDIEISIHSAGSP